MHRGSCCVYQQEVSKWLTSLLPECAGSFIETIYLCESPADVSKRKTKGTFCYYPVLGFQTTKNTGMMMTGQLVTANSFLLFQKQSI